MDAETAAIIDEVIEHLGKLNGSQLSEKICREKPWSDQRKGLLPGQHSRNRISIQSIRDYYNTEDVIFDAQGL